MDNDVLSNLLSMHSKIDEVVSSQKEITNKINSMPCGVNNNRLQNLEKVVYGAVKLILVAFALAVIGTVIYSGDNPAPASAKPAPAQVKEKISK